MKRERINEIINDELLHQMYLKDNDQDREIDNQI
jgi:hypothetical protein